MVAGYEKYVPTVYMPTPQDVPTIGYGTTVNPDTGKRIAFGDQKISEATAKRWLMKDVEMEKMREELDALKIEYGVVKEQYDKTVGMLITRHVVDAQGIEITTHEKI